MLRSDKNLSSGHRLSFFKINIKTKIKIYQYHHQKKYHSFGIGGNDEGKVSYIHLIFLFAHKLILFIGLVT